MASLIKTDIVEAIVKDGQVVGFNIDNDGNLMYFTNRGLYNAAIIEPLVENGYKFYNYNALDVELPDGRKVTELPKRNYSELPTSEILGAEEMEFTVESDAWCSRFYTVPTEIINVLAEPVEVTIKTREELLQYISRCKHELLTSGRCVDHRPLNSFTAREALFSFDEIYADAEIIAYLDILAKRRLFTDFKEYQDTVEWLYRNGKLNTHTPTSIEFISAYFAWGLDGISDDCIDTRVRMAVDGRIDMAGEDKVATTALDNRDKRIILWDRNEHLSYLNNSINTEDISKWGRERVILGSDDELFAVRRASFNEKYYAVTGFVSNVSDRLYLNYMTPNGYNFQVRVSHDRVAVFNTDNFVLQQNGFSISSNFRGVQFSLENIKTADDYYLWNLAYAKINSMVEKRSAKVPVSSTYDLLVKEGLNPQAAIGWMARQVRYEDYDCSKNMKDSRGNKPDYTRAFDIYNNPLDPATLRVFGADIPTDSHKEEFLDLASRTIDDVVEKIPVKASLGSMSPESANHQADMVALFEYDAIKFVTDAVNGSLCIGAYGDGIVKDARDSITSYIELLMTIVYRECGGIVNRGIAEDIINNFEEGGYIDINTIFKVRDMAYKGYLGDTARLRKSRAEGAWMWLYCTKVFRENSNAPVDEQRHYLMECVGCKDRKLRDALTTQVANSIPVTFDERVAALARTQAAWIASRLFYAILFSKGKNLKPTEAGYLVNVSAAGVEPFVVTLNAAIVNAILKYNIIENVCYITLYDYCRFELGSNATFSLYLVNGDVNPWYVTPKQGYAFPTHSFFLNYYMNDALSTLGNEYMTALAESKCKIATPFSALPNTAFLPSDYIDTPDMYDKYTVSSVLDVRMNETVPIYHKRWLWTRELAREMGRVLKTMPLKPDVVWSSIGYSLGYEFSTEPTYFEGEEISNGAHDKMCSYDMAVNVLQFVRSNAKLIEAEIVESKEFDISNFNYEVIRSWYKLLSGTYQNPCLMYVSYGGITIYVNGQPTHISYGQLTSRKLDEFAASDMVFKLNNNNYFVRAVNGDFVLEVK